MRQLISRFLTIFNASAIGDTFVENSDGHAYSRRNYLLGNIFSSFGSCLVSGIYFTSLMLAMGASETYIGYTTTIISICGLFQFLSPFIMERFPRRKGLIIALRSLSHFLNIVVIGVLPLLPIGNTLKLVLFMIALLLTNIFNNLAGPGLSAWQLQSLPSGKRINFFAINGMLVSVFGFLSPLLAGLLLDKFEVDSLRLGDFSPTLSAILLLRVAALIFATLETLHYLKMKEDPYPESSDSHNKPGLNLLLLPLKNRRFIASISIILIWPLFTGLFGPYYSIYLLEDAKISYTLISLSNVISIPFFLISTPIWSRILQKRSWSKTLILAQFLYITPFLLNAFVTSSSVFLFFLSAIAGQLVCPGITLNQTNLLYANMPEENRTMYISFYSVLTQLTTFVSQNIGIQLFRFTDGCNLHLFGLNMCNKQYINFLVVGLIIVTCVYTKLVAKKLPQTT